MTNNKMCESEIILNDYQKIKHHLYGFHDVTKNFSTGDWLKLVNKKIIEVQKRKKIHPLTF